MSQNAEFSANTISPQGDEFRVYGAGLLSSAAELEHSLSLEAKVERFEPETVCKTECLVTTFQKQYYYSNTLEEAKEQLRQVS